MHVFVLFSFLSDVGAGCRRNWSEVNCFLSNWFSAVKGAQEALTDMPPRSQEVSSGSGLDGVCVRDMIRLNMNTGGKAQMELLCPLLEMNTFCTDLEEVSPFRIET